MTGVDPLEALIGEWEAWDANPGSRTVAVARHDALRALGIHGSTAHRTIAHWRRHGYDIPSACQATVNDLAPDHAIPDLKEAS